MSQPSPSEPPAAAPAPARVAPRLIDLFFAFVQIALSGFGGVLYWSHRMIVEDRKWMTPEEFNEAYALCNTLPGGNILNFSVVFGRQVRGLPGALVACAGLLGPPVLLMTSFGMLYAAYGTVPTLQHVLAGVAAAAAGLTIATSLKMAAPFFQERAGRRPSVYSQGLALATFVAVGVLRWPLFWVLGVLIPLGMALALARRT
jgi:chromate transporter